LNRQSRCASQATLALGLLEAWSKSKHGAKPNPKPSSRSRSSEEAGAGRGAGGPGGQAAAAAVGVGEVQLGGVALRSSPLREPQPGAGWGAPQPHPVAPAIALLAWGSVRPGSVSWGTGSGPGGQLRPSKSGPAAL
jgi:hypothetical protein